MSRDIINKPSYEVGYGKPPKHSQFKKGVSGNPSGKPAGKTKRTRLKPKSLKYELPQEKLMNTFLEEAYRMVNINTAQGEEAIPISQAVIRALGVKAAKGHISAQKFFAQTVFEIEAIKRKEMEDNVENIVAYKKHWTEVLEFREKNGILEPPPVPHPDQIILNMDTGTVEIRGPLSQEDKDKQDFYIGLHADWEKQKARYEAALAPDGIGDLSETDKDFFTHQLEQARKIIPMLKELARLDDEPTSLYEKAKLMERDYGPEFEE